MNLRVDTGIYSITHVASGKRYIGSTYCNFYDRFCAHRSTLKRQCHSSILLQRAWNKYGKDAFKFEVIELGSVGLDIRELYFINQYQSSNPKMGYNISKETNNARLGHQQSKATKKKISKSLKGKKKPPGFGEHMSKTRSGKNSPTYGTKQSPELIERRVKNNRKKVIRDDGKIYASVNEAAEDIDALYQGVSQSLRKGYKVKGYRFTYG